MLDDLNELRTLRAIIAAGSLSAAGRALGVSLAVVSKRLSTLERRVGLRLVNRTTRTLSPTDEGLALFAHLDRVLEELDEAEEKLATGRDEPIGTLRVTAPVSFGRRHVAPVLAALVERHPRLDAVLSLDDRLVDVGGGTFDVAIRIGGLGDTSATMLKLADNRRVLAASPAYLDRRGRPRTPDDLPAHTFLRYGDGIAPWMLHGPHDATATIAATPRLRVDNGDALHDWCLAGHGVMMKSVVDMGDDLAAGRLEQVLPGWSGGAMPIVALFASRHHQPRKLRAFLDAMAEAMRR
ncbi:LysR family transcriptional regulator [Methylopila musalis]|uniref:LysR family transcriptional regulator n=1 Tax=Methylopila musalis TaxID=1134781 RepID=A0ABW3Z405_9HYPH